MATKRQAAYVDYQQRAAEFAVGSQVFPATMGNNDLLGRVMAVYPAIGMVDVEWPHGSERVPVEDLQIHTGDHIRSPDLGHDNIPGGAGVVPVNNGPVPHTQRVARAYVKKSLYWAARDRKYKATQEEVDSGSYRCPRCQEIYLRTASYKREEGNSVQLLACPTCLFIIRPCDVMGHDSFGG